MYGLIKWFCVSSGANSTDYTNYFFYLKYITSTKMNRRCSTPDMNTIYEEISVRYKHLTMFQFQMIYEILW